MSSTEWSPEYGKRISVYLPNYNIKRSDDLLLTQSQVLIGALKAKKPELVNSSCATKEECQATLNANLKYISLENLIPCIVSMSETFKDTMCQIFNLGLEYYKTTHQSPQSPHIKRPELDPKEGLNQQNLAGPIPTETDLIVNQGLQSSSKLTQNDNVFVSTPRGNDNNSNNLTGKGDYITSINNQNQFELINCISSLTNSVNNLLQTNNRPQTRSTKITIQPPLYDQKIHNSLISFSVYEYTNLQV